MTSFNDVDAVWKRYPTLPRAWVDVRVAAIILELERERDEARAQLHHAAGVVTDLQDKMLPVNEYVAQLETAIQAFLVWYDAVTPETDEERTEWVGMCEFEALLQDDDDLYIAADDPELAAIVEQMRAALPEALR